MLSAPPVLHLDLAPHHLLPPFPPHHPGLDGRPLNDHHIARFAPCQEPPPGRIPGCHEDGAFLLLLVADDDGAEVEEGEGGHGVVEVGSRRGQVLEVGGVRLSWKGERRKQEGGKEEEWEGGEEGRRGRGMESTTWTRPHASHCRGIASLSSRPTNALEHACLSPVSRAGPSRSSKRAPPPSATSPPPSGQEAFFALDVGRDRWHRPLYSTQVRMLQMLDRRCSCRRCWRRTQERAPAA